MHRLERVVQLLELAAKSLHAELARHLCQRLRSQQAQCRRSFSYFGINAGKVLEVNVGLHSTYDQRQGIKVVNYFGFQSTRS